MAAEKLTRTAHAISERERTSDVLTEENINVDFSSMFLSESVTAGLQKVGFEKPSPIQLKAIPLGRCGLDLIVQAKSGTGKTCVFSVIALESLDLSSPSTQVLILAPTREIAVQIQETIRSIGCEMEGLRCHVFIGGTLFGPDRQKLKKCHVAVGTPGRVKQLIEYDVLKTGSIRLFVLDEADKLLDVTFQEQINWVYNHLPDNKQMLALSATYPESLANYLTRYMREPTFVRLNPRDLSLRGINQLYVELPGHSLPNKAFEIKVIKLLQILTQISFNQCLIFSNLQTRAQNLCDILCDRGWPSECISGSQEQAQRLSAMAKLKKFQCRILISTDLTARGIDAENVNLIINLDIPSDTKTYLHRIGRAGRFGTHGAAISLASRGREVDLLRNIQHKCRVQMTQLPDPAPSDLLKQDPTAAGQHANLDHVDLSAESLPEYRKVDHLDPSRNGVNDDLENTSEDATSISTEMNGEYETQCRMKKARQLITETERSNVTSASKEGDGELGSSKDLQASREIKELSKLNNHISQSIVRDGDSNRSSRRAGGTGMNRNGEQNRITTQKCDVGIQATAEVKMQPERVNPVLRDRQRLHEPVDVVHMLPFGFEDAPEVRNLCLPRWSQCKARDGVQGLQTWHAAKESFDSFMKKRTVQTVDESCKEKPSVVVDLDEEGTEKSINSEGEVFVSDKKSKNGETPYGDLSSGSLKVKSELDPVKIYDRQLKHPDECGDTATKVGHPDWLSSPSLEIQRYNTLLCDAFLHVHKPATQVTDKLEFESIGGGNSVVVNSKRKEINVKDQVPHENFDDDMFAGCKEQIASVVEERQSAVTNSNRGSSSRATKHAGDTENGRMTSGSVAGNRRDERGDDAVGSKGNMKDPAVQQETDSLKQQSVTDSSNSQAMGDVAIEKHTIHRKAESPEVKDVKSNESTKVEAKKKGKQKRIKQHVFQMSTLGVLMSHQELNMAVNSNQDSSSLEEQGDGSRPVHKGDTSDALPGADVIKSGSGIDQSEDRDCQKNYFGRLASASVSKDTNVQQTHQQESIVCESELRKQESSRPHNSMIPVMEAAVAEEGVENQCGRTDNSKAAVGDPVWAIFKRYIPHAAKGERGRKEELTEESTSSESSSCFCESDTSTYVSSSDDGNDDNSDADEQEGEDKGEVGNIEAEENNHYKGIHMGKETNRRRKHLHAHNGSNEHPVYYQTGRDPRNTRTAACRSYPSSEWNMSSQEQKENPSYSSMYSHSPGYPYQGWHEHVSYSPSTDCQGWSYGPWSQGYNEGGGDHAYGPSPYQGYTQPYSPYQSYPPSSSYLYNC